MNASTFTARVVASTGADCAAALSGAVGALSGPLHGGAPSRVLKMIEGVEQTGDAEKWVKDALDRGERLMGFGHRDLPRRGSRARGSCAAPRRSWARRASRSPRRSRRRRSPSCTRASPTACWRPTSSSGRRVILDLADVPADLFTPMFTCARVAGWSAHILEQKREARLIRPTALYVGEAPRPVAAV